MKTANTVLIIELFASSLQPWNNGIDSTIGSQDIQLFAVTLP